MPIEEGDLGVVRKFLLSIVLSVGLLLASPDKGWPAGADCSGDSRTSVTKVAVVKKLGAYQNRDDRSNDAVVAELGDFIKVEVADLGKLNRQRDCAEGSKDFILYLGQRPMMGLYPYPKTDPNQNALLFPLRIEATEQSMKDWKPILGLPTLGAKPLAVSVGVEGRYAIESDKSVLFQAVSLLWLGVWAFVFLLILALFAYLAKRTAMLRDTPENLGLATPTTPPYSLARTQAAWWFFVVLAGYLLVGLVTGNFATSLNGTALGLLAIGAGTTLLSAMIDQTTAPATDAERRKALEEAKAKVEAAEAAGNEAPAAAAVQRKIERPSQNLFIDIISDANGPSFHRFQNVAWSVVLAFVFFKQVYETLAMPDFDATLFGLQGLSAGMYLTLKSQEATVPKG